MEKETPINISWNTLWRVLFFVFLAVLLYLAREAVVVLLASAVISLGLEPLVGFLEKRRIPRILGALIVFFLVLLIFAAAIYLVVPVIASEIGSFFEQLNQAFSSIFGFSISKASLEVFKGGLDKALEFVRTSNISIGGAVSSMFNNLILVAATILVTFYLMVEKDGVERFLRAILPDAYERTILTIFTKFKIKIRRWMLAQLVLSAAVGVLTGLGAWLLGIRYPAVIGILAAVFEIVPVIGPVLVGIIAFLIAISDSLLLGLYALIFFTIVQQFESHVLTPIIIGRTMRIHPVLVIVSLIAGAQVAGFVGVLLAVPIAVAVQEVVGYLSESKSHRPRLDI
jgi:predicted PurR-regulated permease PerM